MNPIEAALLVLFILRQQLPLKLAINNKEGGSRNMHSTNRRPARGGMGNVRGSSTMARCNMSKQMISMTLAPKFDIIPKPQRMKARNDLNFPSFILSKLTTHVSQYWTALFEMIGLVLILPKGHLCLV